MNLTKNKKVERGADELIEWRRVSFMITAPLWVLSATAGQSVNTIERKLGRTPAHLSP